LDTSSSEATPSCGKQEQRQQVTGDADKLEYRCGDICTTGACPVLRFVLTDRIPRRIVWIKGG
jgi:hypothetical protein